jgi:peptidyl-prolyl cis-trans isomerase SurA
MNKQETSTPKNVEEYLQLLINFKLKIAEAQKRGLDTTQKFNNEFKTYREELKRPYRTEPDALDKLAKETYQRLTEEVKASHILMEVKADAQPADTLVAYQKITKARSRALSGENFEKLAEELSEDPSAKYNFGSLGYFTAMQMVYPFEEVAFNTKPGEISDIVRTQFGYHIIKVFDRKPTRGEVEVSHILLRANPGDEKAKGKIFDIYDQLKGGRSWEEVCSEYSEDAATKNSGGRLRPFGVGALANIPEFETTAFSLKQPGDVSDPFRSNIGWHIVRLERKVPLLPFSEMESALKRKLGRDERLQISKQQLVEKRKKDYQFLEDASVKARIFSMADSSLTKGNWQVKPETSLSAQSLFSIQGKPAPASEFIRFAKANQTSVAQSPANYIKQLYDTFLEEKIQLAEEEKLLADHPEFKNLLTEYREGILLFEIMEQEIWNKASEDSVGQRNFYESRKTNYQAGDRVEARILAVPDKHTLDEVLAKVNRGDSLTNADLKKFKSIQPYRVYERNESKVIDAITWTVGLHEASANGQYYLVEVKRLVAPGIKSFEEARASIISDYQDALEKQWIASLKKKFPVKVNGKGRKLIMTELTEKK